MRPLLTSVPQLQRLAVFDAAARAQGFTSAAGELGISQPAVSRHITTLERQLGVQLFARSTNKVALTDAGQVLADAVQTCFHQLETTIDELHGRQRLVLAAQPSLAQVWLLPQFDDLHAHLGDIELNVWMFDRDFQLAPGTFDAAIRLGSGNWVGHGSMRLMPEVVQPVAAPELAERLGLTVDSPPEALIEAPRIHVDREGREWMSWSKWFSGCGVDYRPRPVLVDYGNYPAMMQEAIAGTSIVLSWAHLSQHLVDRGLVVPVGPAVAATERAFHLIWPDHLDADDRVRRLRSWLRSTIPELASVRPS